MSNKWFKETLYTENGGFGYYQSISKDKEIINSKSQFQQIEIFENSYFGKVLTLDGVVQTTERDEFFYHEMFVHVPMIAHGNAKKVLIIGGGDGGILREVLKHSTVEKATMIEIDGDVVNLCAEHMPSLNGNAFKNPKAEVKIDDGIHFIKTTQEKFDIIIVDSTDPINVGEVLFTKEFYENAKRCLNKDGILCTQSGVPFYQDDELKNVKQKISGFFKNFRYFTVPVPTYVGSFMALSFATDGDNHAIENKNLILERIQKNNILDTKYYNEDIHVSCFSLPNYMKI